MWICREAGERRRAHREGGKRPNGRFSNQSCLHHIVCEGSCQIAAVKSNDRAASALCNMVKCDYPTGERALRAKEAVFEMPVEPVAWALPAAVAWTQAVLLGPFGTSVAVLGIALLGLSMFEGRIAWNRAARVVIGIFILFGAPAIAAAFVDSARGGAGGSSAGAEASQAVAPIGDMPAPPQADPDPYAGAAVN